MLSFTAFATVATLATAYPKAANAKHEAEAERNSSPSLNKKIKILKIRQNDSEKLHLNLTSNLGLNLSRLNLAALFYLSSAEIGAWYNLHLENAKFI